MTKLNSNFSPAGKIVQMLLVGFRGRDVRPSDPLAKDAWESNRGETALFDQEMVDPRLRGRNVKSSAQLKALFDAVRAIHSERHCRGDSHGCDS